MKSVIQKTIRVFKFAVIIFIGTIICYLILGFTLSIIPANNNNQRANEGVAIYVSSNGVHTDIIVPTKNEIYDWNENLCFQNIYNPTNSNFLSFGWGNKDFYLKCKTWNDLKLTTAFNAAFGLSSALMHVSCFDNMRADKNCCKILITQHQYKELVDEIKKSFQKSATGNIIEVAGGSYFNNDSFFEANGNYHLFNTCNSWTNNTLKKIGLKTAIWTPFDFGIFYYLN